MAIGEAEIGEDAAPDRSHVVAEWVANQLTGAGGVACRFDVEREEFQLRRHALDQEETPHQRIEEGFVELAVRQRGDAYRVGRPRRDP